MVAAFGAGHVAYAQPGAESGPPTASHAAFGGSGMVQISNRPLPQVPPPDSTVPGNDLLRRAPLTTGTAVSTTANPRIVAVSLDSDFGNRRW